MSVPVESLYEIGYMLWGRKSIYLISFIIWIASTGLMMVYFIVFGDISASIVRQVAYPNKQETFENVWVSRWPYVLMIGLLLVPLVIMRELKELKVISMTLFAGIGIFLSLFIFQMIKYGLKENKDVDYSIYWEAKFDTALLTSFAIILVGYGFQQNLFPLFMSLQGNTQQKNKQSKRSIILALSATLIVYMSVGILCLYDFGSELSGNVLDNIDKEVNWSSYVIRSAFLIVLACHIPYIFFSGKESLLIMIEETRDQSMSTAL